MVEPISIFMVDDHKLFMQSFEAYLSTQSNFAWVGSSADTAKTYKDIIQLRPAIVLLDFHLQGKNGLELLKDLRSNGFSGKIVLLTMNRDRQIRSSARIFGADGFVSKEVNGDELLQGLLQLMHGEINYLELPEDDGQEVSSPYKLTKQELVVARMVCSGLTTEVIAEKLLISVHTVHTHRRRILEKTGSSNFMEVAHKIIG